MCVRVCIVCVGGKACVHLFNKLLHCDERERKRERERERERIRKERIIKILKKK